MQHRDKPRRAISFIDGQNLFRHAKSAFGYHHPNFDPLKLAKAVCRDLGLDQHMVRFYTGFPRKDIDPFWHGYWSNRFRAMSRSSIHVIKRRLSYQTQRINLAGGQTTESTVVREKGIDVRISLDVFKMLVNGEYDAAIIFSQDQDLAEAVADVREYSERLSLGIRVYSAFPSSSTASSTWKIRGTIPFPMDRAFYDACIDHSDYRPFG
ncbi:MAG: NYN domain-containing protein [Gammaproteobacteria bacterium]|nr:NYN domain-containing protein [Gammaproteobacteria bacterium]